MATFSDRNTLLIKTSLNDNMYAFHIRLFQIILYTKWHFFCSTTTVPTTPNMISKQSITIPPRLHYEIKLEDQKQVTKENLSKIYNAALYDISHRHDSNSIRISHCPDLYWSNIDNDLAGSRVSTWSCNTILHSITAEVKTKHQSYLKSNTASHIWW